MTIHKFVIPFNSVKDISDKELLDLHRKYWRFIGDNDIDGKPDIIFENGKEADIKHHCFLCEYARRRRLNNSVNVSFCDFCPVEAYRETELGCERVHNAPYRKWVFRYSTNISDEKRRAVAYEISELELVET